jgi:hypothetical protein
MNEGVLRSPKWLRNFIDFEINTGDDIKGEPSKRAKRKEDLNRWDKKWKEVDKDDFKSFFKDVYQKSIYDFELSDIRKELRGNFDIWKKYDEWDSKRKAEQERRKLIEKEINDIYERLISDFTKNPWRDKITIKTGPLIIEYKFDNGDELKLDGNKLGYLKWTYTISREFVNLFLTLLNKLIEMSRSRYNSNDGYHKYNTDRNKKTNKSTGHPKEGLYNTLKQTIIQRKEQLRKLPPNHPDRKSLENELANAESKLKDMKDRYKFENIKNYEMFFRT